MELVAGSVGVDENGELDGLVYEPDAMAYAWNKYYDFPDDQMKAIMRHFMKGLAAHGVTSLSEMSADDYEEMFHHRYEVFKEMAGSRRIYKQSSRIYRFYEKDRFFRRGEVGKRV